MTRAVPDTGRVKPTTAEQRELSPDKVLDLFEEHSVAETPYHPQVQFLYDVDGDGLIDHLYCCEAAALEYLNNRGYNMDPFDLETHDTLVEYTKLNRYGPDAGWGAAILALLDDTPTVYGYRSQTIKWAATYRVPADLQSMKAAKTVANHDLLVVGATESFILVHCTYNGPAAVPKDQFDRACIMLTTTVDHDPVPPGPPSQVADRLISATDHPVIATVNAHAITGYRLGTVPFITAVERSWRDDWRAGLRDDLPPSKDDRACYLAAIVEKDRFPVWTKAEHEWLKWLEENQKNIVPGYR